MSMSEEKEVKCPFYKGMTMQGISCEGLTDDSTLKLLFTSPEKRKSHCKRFCRTNYKTCEIYKLLEKKYEE